MVSSSLPLFPQLAEMSDEEKYGIVARFIPCDLCSTCKGWHPYESNQANCQCGHDTFHHIDNAQDLDRRLKVAFRLNELLEVDIYHCTHTLIILLTHTHTHTVIIGKRENRRLRLRRPRHSFVEKVRQYMTMLAANSILIDTFAYISIRQILYNASRMESISDGSSLSPQGNKFAGEQECIATNLKQT